MERRISGLLLLGPVLPILLLGHHPYGIPVARRWAKLLVDRSRGSTASIVKDTPPPIPRLLTHAFKYIGLAIPPASMVIKRLLLVQTGRGKVETPQRELSLTWVSGVATSALEMRQETALEMVSYFKRSLLLILASNKINVPDSTPLMNELKSND
ncbi:hypothetical protein CRG98_022941 [Punica granatum]|uniref:Uncharacterized protein n=1 Tax=Punica granatum TaxID=22663 RepID=A0A2I0JK90_PUNGR|nr:hypothetical protein CRG98_022941 [Punica granatum]